MLGVEEKDRWLGTRIITDGVEAAPHTDEGMLGSTVPLGWFSSRNHVVGTQRDSDSLIAVFAS